MWFIGMSLANLHLLEKYKLTSPNRPPPRYSFTHFPSLSQSEYTIPVPTERNFGKPEFGNFYLNTSRNSNFFCKWTKPSDSLYEESTFYSSDGYTLLSNTND